MSHIDIYNFTAATCSFIHIAHNALNYTVINVSSTHRYNVAWYLDIETASDV